MLKAVYCEITNVCNLACSFCPGTARPPATMTPARFRRVAEEVRGKTEYLCLHLLGEPTLHPRLGEILEICRAFDLPVNLTTNGTLLDRVGPLLCASPALRRVAISLQCHEGNAGGDPGAYLDKVWHFCEAFGGVVALRLWNGGGADAQNGEILAYLSRKCGVDLAALPGANGSHKIRDRLFWESGETFAWPSLSAQPQEVGYCHALTRQIGILADGRVVPCCLDSEGTVTLGNIFREHLDDILAGPRATQMRHGFARRCPTEELCRRCGYATRFQK